MNLITRNVCGNGRRVYKEILGGIFPIPIKRVLHNGLGIGQRTGSIPPIRGIIPIMNRPSGCATITVHITDDSNCDGCGLSCATSFFDFLFPEIAVAEELVAALVGIAFAIALAVTVAGNGGRGQGLAGVLSSVGVLVGAGVDVASIHVTGIGIAGIAVASAGITSITSVVGTGISITSVGIASIHVTGIDIAGIAVAGASITSVVGASIAGAGITSVVGAGVDVAGIHVTGIGIAGITSVVGAGIGIPGVVTCSVSLIGIGVGTLFVGFFRDLAGARTRGLLLTTRSRCERECGCHQSKEHGQSHDQRQEPFSSHLVLLVFPVFFAEGSAAAILIAPGIQCRLPCLVPVSHLLLNCMQRAYYPPINPFVIIARTVEICPYLLRKIL